MILLIDNYDSFVFNLARYFERLGQHTHVVRNDSIDAECVGRWQPEAIILSPGPCAPDQAGCSLDVVRQHYRTIPILGVCLGHQVIAQALGGKIVRAAEPVHGRASPVFHNRRDIFNRLVNPLTVGRYHSLIVDPTSLPDELTVTARTSEGTVMAVAHVEHPTVGVQFHPESILTEHGYELLANFLRLANLLPPLEDDAEVNMRGAIAVEWERAPAVEAGWPIAPVTF